MVHGDRELALRWSQAGALPEEIFGRISAMGWEVLPPRPTAQAFWLWASPDPVAWLRRYHLWGFDSVLCLRSMSLPRVLRRISLDLCDRLSADTEQWWLDASLVDDTLIAGPNRDLVLDALGRPGEEPVLLGGQPVKTVIWAEGRTVGPASVEVITAHEVAEHYCDKMTSSASVFEVFNRVRLGLDSARCWRASGDSRGVLLQVTGCPGG